MIYKVVITKICYVECEEASQAGDLAFDGDCFNETEEVSEVSEAWDCEYEV